MSPRERIDVEDPPRAPAPNMRHGRHAWFVDNDGAWYLVESVSDAYSPNIMIKSVTGLDADHRKPWPYGGELEFGRKSPLQRRLRPLSARRP